jgi:hypothetical protein
MTKVSTPAGALITSVVDGLLRYCWIPPFTVIATLRAVAGTYAGRRRAAVGVLAVVQCIAKVTLAAPAFPGTEDGTGAAEFDAPLPEHPANVVSAATTRTDRRATWGRACVIVGINLFLSRRS